MSLQARREMPWGSSIPEREFRHFVLPVRVNNEHLDNSREVFYGMLKDRVKHLSLHDAILEVNHWCHEKVTYRPSDARTSSPLATLSTAYGRCGEESTFLVAALRAVGIPARQVYTPRWAHTDDNHAWVEAWADGKWYFLGACEPEPVLNLGWFNESASRGLLMHTKVFGRYDGPEEVIAQTPYYTEINVVSHYAPTAQINVTVTDTTGKPVKDAQVAFKVYNYAELFTVATKSTDANGHTFLTAGKGDIVVWASQKGKAAFAKVSIGKDSLVTLRLGDTAFDQAQNLDIVPPPSHPNMPQVSVEQRAENQRRLAAEDALRKAYEATMQNEAYRGNHATIAQFLQQAPNRIMAEKLLSVLSAKDLRDVTADVLDDNAVNRTDTSQLYLRYVLSPRVENEQLTPYKHFFAKTMAHISSPKELVKWCNRHIKVDDTENPQQLRMEPMSVYKERRTDALGRSIFFVSVARSLGWPARIDEVTGKLQYYENNHWIDVYFGKDALQFTQNQEGTKGTFAPVFHPSERNADPKYYIHFTIGKIVDGDVQLLNFPDDATWKNTFEKGVKLDAGHYMLTTGTRLASGDVLARLQPFTVEPGKTIRPELIMRADTNRVQVIGSFNAENLFTKLHTSTPGSLLATAGRGFYVVGIVAPNQEPTNHALRDIAAAKEELEKWGRSIILLFEGSEQVQRFNFAEFANLPNTVTWGIDNNGTILREVTEQMKLRSDALPVFLICDSFNRVVFVKQGYTIHLGEQLVNTIKKLQ